MTPPLRHADAAEPATGTTLPVFRLGTRGSALALAQADLVIAALTTAHPELRVERVIVKTDGDVDQTSPLTAIGGRGVFTSALQEAIRRGTIDAAVHSAKDLPSDEPQGLELAAVLLRDDPRDVLVSRHGRPLAELPPNPTIGTSSRRRAIQVLAVRPDARIVNLRGNVDTRLRKALETDLDGIVLAAAGIRRMGWDDRITEVLPLDRFVPSPGQGALAVETRADPSGVAALVPDLDDPAVSLPVATERAFLRGIGGGCTTPVGAHATIEDGAIRLRGMLASDDGDRVVWADERLPMAEAEGAAFALAQALIREIGGASPDTRRGHWAVADRPLAALSVLVTRPADQAEGFARALSDAGAEPLIAPMLRIVPPADSTPLDAALARVARGGFDWVVFTSGNAVEHVFDRLAAVGLDGRVFAGVRVAAVGAATAAALERAAVSLALLPDRFDAEALLEALVARGVDGQRVLLPQGSLARDVLAKGLAGAGALVDVVEAYRTLPADDLEPAIRARLNAGRVDVLTFASPSSARTLAALLGDAPTVLKESAVACVGPVTAQAAREVGLRVDIVAADATIPGLVAALVANRDRIEATRAARRIESDAEGIGERSRCR